MFNRILAFFDRRPQYLFCITARYGSGHWFKNFEVGACNAYDAARKFDTDPENVDWIRVSGATRVD